MKKLFYNVSFMLFGAILLTGCSNTNNEYWQESYTVSANEIKELNIDVRDRKIEVSLSDDDQIHIDYYENDKEYYDITVSDGDVLKMTTESNREWEDYIGSKATTKNRTISLKIPDTLLSSLVLSTTNENISLPELTVTDTLSLSTNGGDITFENLNVGRSLFLETKNGDISGTVIGSYDDFAITSKVKKGESNLPKNKENGKKYLSVVNNNGNINIEFLEK